MEMSPGFEIPRASLAWLAKFPARMHTHSHLFPCSQTWSGNPSTSPGPCHSRLSDPGPPAWLASHTSLAGTLGCVQCSALDSGCSESALHPGPQTPREGGSETGAEGAPWCEEGMGCLLPLPVPTNCAPHPPSMRSGLCVSGCLELAPPLEASSALPSGVRRETS